MNEELFILAIFKSCVDIHVIKVLLAVFSIYMATYIYTDLFSLLGALFIRNIVPAAIFILAYYLYKV